MDWMSYQMVILDSTDSNVALTALLPFSLVLFLQSSPMCSETTIILESSIKNLLVQDPSLWIWIGPLKLSAFQMRFTEITHFIKPDLTPLERHLEASLLKQRWSLINTGLNRICIKVWGQYIFKGQLHAKYPDNQLVFSNHIHQHL